MPLSSDDLVVITAASGKQGTHLIPHLYEHSRLRLVVHSDASSRRLSEQYPKADVVQADMALPQDCATVVKGASTIYHVGPPLHAHEKEIGYNMVDAAVVEAEKPDSQLKHFVFSSVLNTQIRRMANHDDKRYIEERLIESGVNFTVLSPPDFFENFRVAEWVKQERPVFRSFMGLKSRSCWCCLRDLGEASAKVILEREKHYQGFYPLVSVPPMAYGDVPKLVGKLIGKEIELVQLSFEEAVETLGLYIFGGIDNASAIEKDKVERLILFYRRRGLQGNTNVLEWLLGRKPTSIEEFTKLAMQQNAI